MITERVDDIPLIIAEFEKSKLCELFCQHFPNHGNWRGADGGQVAVIFLTYVLSCSDHKISHVETWAEQRLTTLRCCLNNPNLSSKDLTDDKIGALLDKFSDENRWSSFEHAHNQRLINVYDLNKEDEAIRLDAMITQSHRAASGDFQYGHSKQHRSDLPQLKTMVATLDPFAMPLYSITVAGNTADDVLYLPVLEELMSNLTLNHQLFVGDSKMGSLNTRVQIHQRGHYYLIPLSKKQCSEQELATYLANKPAELVTVSQPDKTGKAKIKAQAFEQTKIMVDEAQAISWEERRIIVYSPAYAKRQQTSFEDRLIKAQNALQLLLEPKQGRKQAKTSLELEEMVLKILKKHRVMDFITYQIKEHQTTRTVRAHLDRPEEIRTTFQFSLEFEVNQLAKEQYEEKLGWRVYACNAPLERLSTAQAIECYRNEYKIEHKFDELLNKITALMPVYLHKPNRIKALVRLLFLALKYVSLIQYQVRTELKATKQTIKELYPGNPGRATDKPTTRMLLKAFDNITLVIMPIGDKIIVKISDLKPIQLKILELLKLPPETYLRFNELNFSHFDFSET